MRTGGPRRRGTYFLLCHAVELALKAWADWHGEDAKQLQAYRHDLVALLAAGRRDGLSLTPRANEDIGHLAPIHKEHLPRDPVWTGATILIIDQFEPTAIELLEACCAVMRGDSKSKTFVSY